MDNVLKVVPFALDAKREEIPSKLVFRVEIFALDVFIVPDASVLVVVMTFETHTFPRTLTFAPERPIEF